MKELYNTTLEVVCNVCEVNKIQIFNSNKEDIVDARYIFVYILSIKLTDIEISKMTGFSKSLVNKVRNTFNMRIKKYSLKYKFKKVEDLLSSYKL